MKAIKIMTLMAVIILFCCVHGSAQVIKQLAVARLSSYEVKPQDQQRMRQALSKYVSGAITNSGNIMAEAYYELEKPSVFWLIERWSSKKEMDKFSGANIVPLNPLKVYELTDLEPINKQQWRKTAKKEDRPLTVMLFVDAKKGTEESFKTIYHQAMPKFRSEPGVITYQLSQLVGDASGFVTYEKFRSPEAFTYHLNFPPIKPIVSYLETSIKKPPFQQGLHNLIEFAPLTRTP